MRNKIWRITRILCITILMVIAFRIMTVVAVLLAAVADIKEIVVNK